MLKIRAKIQATLRFIIAEIVNPAFSSLDETVQEVEDIESAVHTAKEDLSKSDPIDKKHLRNHIRFKHDDQAFIVVVAVKDSAVWTK